MYLNKLECLDIKRYSVGQLLYLVLCRYDGKPQHIQGSSTFTALLPAVTCRIFLLASKKTCLDLDSAPGRHCEPSLFADMDTEISKNSQEQLS